MTVVLHTNVVSELMRATPAPAVLAWLRQTSSTDLYTRAATLATRNTKDFIDTGVMIIDPWQRTTI